LTGSAACYDFRKEKALKIRETKKSLLILLAVLAAMAFPSQSKAAGPADAAFKKLVALEGHWEGKDAQGQVTTSTFQSIASATAVMETLVMPGMHSMVTLYSVDVDSIVLVHYCPTNNQPRMRAVAKSAEVKELVFSFQGAGNMPDPAAGHEHKLVMQFEDKDHITERWTWRQGGKDTEMVFHLARTPSAKQ
jgi:hypothetical protein